MKVWRALQSHSSTLTDGRYQRQPQRAIREPTSKAAFPSIAKGPIHIYGQVVEPGCRRYVLSVVVSAAVAIFKIAGIETPFTYWSAAVGGMFGGGLVAIIHNQFPPRS